MVLLGTEEKEIDNKIPNGDGYPGYEVWASAVAESIDAGAGLWLK